MISTRTIIAVLATLSLAAGASLAQGRGGGGAHAPSGGGHAPGGGRPPGGGQYHGGGYQGGYYRGGHYPYYGFWGGVGVGIGLGYWGWPYYGSYYGAPYYYGSPYYYGAPVVVSQGDGAAAALSSSSSPSSPTPPGNAPEPIFYPRNGQGDAQREVDLRECNRWATTQAAAMTDASVFMRATFACMDGRGYTGR